MEDRLRKFCQVVDYGGFTKAAAALHISQPALTAAVKKLERELNVVLLERQSKRLQLTTAGTKAYRTAKAVNTELYNLRQELTSLARRRPSVRLGMTDSLADILAGEPRGIGALTQAADLSVVVDNSSQLTLAILKEHLEAALIVGGSEALPNSLSSIAIGDEPLALVVHPGDWPMYQQALAGGILPSFLSYNIGSHSQQLIQTALEEQSILVQTVFYSTSPEVMLRMVMGRQGAAVLPYATVKPYLRSDGLRSLPLGRSHLSRPIYAIQLKGRQLPPALEQTFQTTSAALGKFMADAAKLKAVLS